MPSQQPLSESPKLPALRADVSAKVRARHLGFLLLFRRSVQNPSIFPIPAEKLLQQELVTARKTENGQWYAITTDPQPEMVEMEQIQEMHL